MIITFCGHSRIQHSKEIECKIKDVILSEARHTPLEFYLGFYGDFDFAAFRCCIDYKNEHGDARIFFVTPYIDGKYIKTSTYPSVLTKPYIRGLNRFPKDLRYLRAIGGWWKNPIL